MNVKTSGIESRGLIESAALPDGHSIGLTLTDAGGYTYDNISYKNIKATASTGTTPQTWALANDMLLSSTAGTLYGYYPYNSAVTDITQVPITAGDTDYMYATPVENLNDGNYNATITMNHALTAIRVTVCKAADNDDEATLNCLRVQSDAFCQSATLDATTGTLTGLDGTGIEQQKTSLGQALSFAGSTYDFMVIPGNGSNDMTFTATINNQEFVGTVDNVTLQQGYIYSYTLTFSRQERELTITKQSVSPWNRHDKISMGMQLNDPWEDVDFVDESSVANGVYAVAPNGKLVADINTVDEEIREKCIAVALIVDNSINTYASADGGHTTPGVGNFTAQRLMIEKNGEANTTSIKAAYTADGATNTGYQYFYWGMYDSDIASITNYTTIDGTNTYGYFVGSTTPRLSTDYTTWTSGALSDFNGKANTAALIDAEDTDAYTSFANMGTYCKIFNGTAAENQGYTDWYIPASGQLALIYLNMDEINEILTAIGGTTLAGSYWSSSEGLNTCSGVGIQFHNGYMSLGFGKSNYNRVRLVRDIL